MSTARPASPSASPATIASASLPPRVRKILQDFFTHISPDIINALNGMLPAFEQQLFKQAELARSNHRQAEQLANLRTFQRNSGELVPHFMFALEAELARIRLPPARPSDAHAPVEFRTLTLVEDAVMDREIVLHDIGRRHEARAATAVLLLGQRFGVLAGTPAFDAERLPVGPQALCRFFLHAAETLELDLESQLLLFRTFDHKVMLNYNEWAETLNQYLSQAGVLPGLIFMPRRVRAQDSAAAPARHPGNAGGPRPLTGWQGQAVPSWHQLTPQALQAESAAMPAGAGSGQAPPEPHAGASVPGPGGNEEVASFASLQQLLSMYRDAAGGSGAGGDTHPGAAVPAGSPAASAVAREPGASTLGGVRPSDSTAADATGTAPPVRKLLSTPAVLDALKSLQQTPQAQEPGQPRRRVQDLQQSLLQQVRSEHGPQAALASADADTFELLGLLYDQIEREVQQDAPAADLLVQLQVPVVQAALRDREFFLRAQHPARELLNAVAESGATWLDPDEVDPQLAHKLHEVINDVVARYDGDDGVFDQANQSVQQHLRVAARKAELAERRHVEAARGKDRLEVAKQRAAETIQTALRDHEQKPQKFVQALLNQAWADVLTLTLLRNGDQSDEWHQQLQTTLQIAAATTSAGQANPDPELSTRIEKSLTQVGYHDDEAAAIARRLSSAEGDDETTSRTELTARLKARARVGEQSAARKKPPHPRTEREQECYDYLRTLPFGTWFEFARNQQGDMQRQRLSWFSPITGNALFVNQRGQRVGEHSLDYVAHMMAQGQAQVVTEDKGRLIDRAWNATLKALRSLTGTASNGAAPTGGAA
ncbi:DUF1631 domain-containing protein [Pseudoxanthomonas wuyuanensis]|uniref:Thymidine phosphorylase n=1 Tax=Pseudoxanthomonas wuyuanensis TaxID=1073196 RepID=A0A286D3E6_9GAMM|nr:DUF1631 domain-containing protein [Pseudoxanthomonas wuyuanensis]KAF1722969.1 DUF1631 domain-containing protein [Pseudoxanthomonas wuyuanensis]SOD53170.1 Protein of unknown function [Pseudoxanthomonas wuyuanensis]